jgi:tRNA-specific 2-thiouridylase
MDKNEVYVTTDLNDNTLWKKVITLTAAHWIGNTPSEGEYSIRVRHRAKLIPSQLRLQDDEVILELSDPERAVAAGQSVVIYKDDVCIGGGIVA